MPTTASSIADPWFSSLGWYEERLPQSSTLYTDWAEMDISVAYVGWKVKSCRFAGHQYRTPHPHAWEVSSVTLLLKQWLDGNRVVNETWSRPITDSKPYFDPLKRSGTNVRWTIHVWHTYTPPQVTSSGREKKMHVIATKIFHSKKKKAEPKDLLPLHTTNRIRPTQQQPSQS